MAPGGLINPYYNKMKEKQNKTLNAFCHIESVQYRISSESQLIGVEIRITINISFSNQSIFIKIKVFI
jgi:hypothetical protein